jgi:hypothetical protein
MKSNRLKKGERTPNSNYYLPLLRVLVHLGGASMTDMVLDRVGLEMKSKLKLVDYEYLDSGEIRWRNAVCWCRNDLVKKGLMKSDSPHGIWEIDEKGRELVQKKDEQLNVYHRLIEMRAFAMSHGLPFGALDQAINDSFPLPESADFLKPKGAQ